MYGVPADLDLHGLHGATLTQLAIGEFQVQFRFTPETEIAVEGRWELRDRLGHMIDHAQTNAGREAYRIHQLLGRHVVGSYVKSPVSFVLEFDSGHRLEVFDSSKEFESFSIQPGGVIV